MRVWPLPGISRRMGYAGGSLFVLSRDRGLTLLTGDSLVTVPGGEALVGTQPARLLPTGNAGMLLLTRTDALFHFDGKRVVSFPTEADALLREALVMDGTYLPGGGLALATLRRGLLLLDASGHLVGQVGRDGGLRDADVKAVLLGPQGALWLGLNNGLARVDAGMPATYFGADEGLPGFVVDVARHDGRLFAATSDGIRVLEPASAPGAAATFRALPDLIDHCHALLPTESSLVAACDHGVHTVTATGHRPLMTVESAFTLHRSRAHPGWLYVGLNDGVAVMTLRGGRWQFAARIENLRTEVRSLAEADGVLWIGTAIDGLYHVRVTADPEALVARRVQAWAGTSANVFLDDGHVLVSGAGRGVYRVVRESERAWLRPDTTLAQAPPIARRAGLSRLARTAAGTAWMHAGSATGLLYPGVQGAAAWDDISGFLTTDEVYALYPERDGVLWIGMAEGLARYDTRRETSSTAPQARVRRLSRGEAVLYGGEGVAPDLRLEHDPAGLRFAFSAPGASAARFQTRLDGQEADWSAWTAETQRDYTNLSGGRYTFRVRARDAQGGVGPEAALSFVVLPPWYRTGWAYALYALLVLGAGYALVWLNGLRLRARNAHLEAVVHARTATVEAQKEALLRQNAQIEEQATRLLLLDEARTRFFANISHEFRTPLTLTLGPLDDVIEGVHGEVSAGVKGTLGLARRSAYRLLRLVNRLLDLARLESGHMPLAAQPADLADFVQRTAETFAPLAARRQVTLRHTAPAAPFLVAFDPDKVEEVLVNLLSNAFKATSAGGEIHVSTTLRGDVAEVRVADTGAGIDPESLSVIFDRFQRGKHALPGTTGTGIGLNLVQELVHLHGGSVTVESERGRGTTFTVLLPRAVPDAAPGFANPPDAPVVHAPIENAPRVEAATSETLPYETADRPTVLVVDDHADIRAYVRQHLETAYAVVEAADGDEGFEKARSVLPDLVVSDVMMPRRDGFSLCRALKADPALGHVPVILLTAKASGESRLEGLDAEADDYLTKPFDARELLARARNLLAQRQRLRDRFRQEIVVQPSGVTVTSTDAAFLEHARATIEAHLSDTDFSVEALAGAVALSPSQLQRRVKALTGLTPVQLVVQMRLARAADLLAQGAGSVSEIAYGVGFNAHAYFAQRFRERYGVTPSAYAAGERDAEMEPDAVP